MKSPAFLVRESRESKGLYNCQGLLIELTFIETCIILKISVIQMETSYMKGDILMKKIACLFVTLMLLCSACSALAENHVDLSVLSDDELLKLMNRCYSELADRSNQSDTTLYEDKELGIAIKFAGVVWQSYTGGGELRVMGTISNRSEREVSIHVKQWKIFVNNWTVECFGGSLDAKPGRNTHNEICQTNDIEESAGLTKLEELDTLECTFVVEVDGVEVKEIPFTYTHHPNAQ